MRKPESRAANSGSLSAGSLAAATPSARRSSTAERKAIIGFLRRDPTLTEDERIEIIENEKQHLKLQKEIKDYFVHETKDEEMEQSMAEYDRIAKAIDAEDAQTKHK